MQQQYTRCAADALDTFITTNNVNDTYIYVCRTTLYCNSPWSVQPWVRLTAQGAVFLAASSNTYTHLYTSIHTHTASINHPHAHATTQHTHTHACLPALLPAAVGCVCRVLTTTTTTTTSCMCSSFHSSSVAHAQKHTPPTAYCRDGCWKVCGTTTRPKPTVFGDALAQHITECLHLHRQGMCCC